MTFRKKYSRIKKVFVTGGSPQVTSGQIPMEREILKALMRDRYELYGMVWGMVRNRDDAEDLLQELAVTVVEQVRHSKWNEIDDLSAWLKGVAWRLAKNHLRRHAQRRTRPVPSDELLKMIRRVHQEDGSSSDELGREQEALQACLSGMKSSDRKLLRKRYVEFVDYAILSEQLRKSGAAVRQTVSRLRRNLMMCIERRLSHPG